MRFITHHEVKQGLVGDRMRAVIVGEFGMGNVISPRSGGMFQLLGLPIRFLHQIEGGRQWREKDHISGAF